jgi:hypothetical protein
MMYRRNDGSLASDNFFANNAFMEYFYTDEDCIEARDGDNILFQSRSFTEAQKLNSDVEY